MQGNDITSLFKQKVDRKQKKKIESIVDKLKNDAPNSLFLQLEVVKVRKRENNFFETFPQSQGVFLECLVYSIIAEAKNNKGYSVSNRDNAGFIEDINEKLAVFERNEDYINYRAAVQKVVSEYDSQLTFPNTNKLNTMPVLINGIEIFYNAPDKIKSKEPTGGLTRNKIFTFSSAIVLIGAIVTVAMTISKVGALATLVTALSGFAFPLAIAGAALVGVIAGVAFVYNTYQWVKKSRQKQPNCFEKLFGLRKGDSLTEITTTPLLKDKNSDKELTPALEGNQNTKLRYDDK